MTTPLEKTVRRALSIGGRDYVVSLSPEGIKLTIKGHRLGVELKWADLVSGEAALATALQASLGRFSEDKPAPPAKSERPQERSQRPPIKSKRPPARSKASHRGSRQ
jgi:hypothetical protein